MRRYIDEFLELPEEEWLVPNFEGIKKMVHDYSNKGLAPKEIVKKLQKDLYIFTDEKETDWELKVVNNILEGNPVKNRFTEEIFNFY